jgi:uncharacterized membrane protein YdbT with pleckstrin-like domain
MWVIIGAGNKAMYCSKCGTDNADDAVYCKKCGALVEAEDETRVAVRKDEGGRMKDEEESRIFSITPTVKFVMVGYAAAVIGAFVFVALVSLFLTEYVSLPVGIILGLLLLIVPAFYHLKKKLVRYTLTDTTIEIDRGLISRTTQNIPLRRVQDVTVTASVFQRILGYGDIEIDNASDGGGKIILDDIDSPKRYSEMILKQMRQLDR